MDEYSWAEILYCLFLKFSVFIEEDLVLTSRKNSNELFNN
jgi:hypothetical protein